jgi:hypothetical protein
MEGGQAMLKLSKSEYSLFKELGYKVKRTKNKYWFIETNFTSK